jgi:hypothetical protein
MRRRYILSALLAVAAILAAGCAGTYEGESSASYDSSDTGDVGPYYDDLAPYGTWVNVDPYGWSWCPLDTPFGWRPYTVGYWAYTDWGWMWMSEDPWGWTPYRYGRWTYDAFYGWIWIPGDTWAPAWVAWRYGGGWVGWAPLPPGAEWSAGVGLSWGPTDLDRHIDRFGWSFVPERAFPTMRERLRVEPAGRNVTLLRVTKNVTSYEDVNSVPVSGGLRKQEIERAIGRSIPEYHVVESTSPTRERTTVIRGQDIEVYRPRTRIAERLRERLDAMPPEQKPAPPPRLFQRQEKEREQIQQRLEQQRQRLDQAQQRELKQPPRGVSAAELRQRQQEEQRAQQELEQRQRQMMQEREQRLRERIRQREDAKARAEEERDRDKRERDRARQERDRDSQERDRTQERDRGR